MAYAAFIAFEQFIAILIPFAHLISIPKMAVFVYLMFFADQEIYQCIMGYVLEKPCEVAKEAAPVTPKNIDISFD